MASTNAVLSTILGPPGRASSRRTLDLDSLTYQTLFLRSQAGMDPSQYYLPIIPGDGTVVKQLDYYTVQQALSVGGFYVTPSTIGDVIAEVTALSTYQLVVNSNVSSVSTIVGDNILSLSRNISTYQGTINFVTFTPSYNAMKSTFDSAVLANSTANSIQSNVDFLTSGLSSLSTAITSSFTWLNNRIEILFNQGPQVSTLSTFVSEYYNNLSESISSYSTTVGGAISTNYFTQTSTLVGLSNVINASIQAGTGPGVSTLSTQITSTFLASEQALLSLDPGPGMSSISSYVTPALSSFSTQFTIQLAIPGICSLSTYFTGSYSTSIAYAREESGVYGLSTLSSVMSTQGGLIINTINSAANDPRISSFSTLISTQVAMISDIVCTIGFTYTILQQELLKFGYSTTSTSFGIAYSNMTSLCTFSSMLNPAYSTLYEYFNVSSPYNSISTLSTIQQSTILGTGDYLNSVYPEIFTGPGISAISTNVPVEISTLSTYLYTAFSSFSNDIFNVSAIRTDTGVSSLSSFLYYSTLQIQSTSDEIANLITLLNISTTNFQEQISDLRVFDSTTYASLELSTNLIELSLQYLSTTEVISSVSLYYQNITCSMSTYISTTVASTISLYGDLVSSFLSTTSSYNAEYLLVSSLASTNLFSPVFSSFYADSITTSSLVAYNQMAISSLLIKNPALQAGPYTNFYMQGSLYIEPQPYFGTPYIFVASNTGGNTIFYANSASGSFSPSLSPNQFNEIANDIVFANRNGTPVEGVLWIAAGSNSGGAGSIKYSTDPVNTWEDATIPPGITSVYTVQYNGFRGLAGTEGATSILWSINLQLWFDAISPGMSTLTKVNKFAYDGTRWVGVGSNTTNPYTIVYADDDTFPPVWKSAGDTFSTEGRSVTTNGRIWVAAGSPEALKYSFNARSWFNVTGASFSTSANAVAWNGEKFVAVGQNTNNSNIMFSYNGQTWSHASNGAGFSTLGQTLNWDGSNWLATGTDTPGGNSKLLYSPDGITWTTNANAFPGVIQGQAFASNVRPAIEMTTFDIYSGNIPSFNAPDKRRMQIIQSTVQFNNGDFVIRHDTDTGVGYVGINQSYPEYALDIGIGNARKPSGTTWVTSSDARVKTNIVMVDIFSCAQTLLQIPLRQFSYTDAYRQQTGIRDIPYYGFIAQEVKEVMPNSVRISQEFGLPDFHSLDADQLFKIEFGATQYLIKAVEEVEQKLSTLESYQKNRG